MRSLFRSLAPLLMMLVIGCNFADPDECRPNTSGGFGGGGTIPIGAGVGATGSGDYLSEPPKGPLDNSGTPNPCMAGGTHISHFQPSTFPFVTTVADDGTGDGGGWQVANAGLIFGPSEDGGKACVGVIEMPLRTRAWGRVPPNIAAIYTAKAANAAAAELEDDGSFNLPPGIFCNKFDTELKKQFKKSYDGMGARITVKSP